MKKTINRMKISGRLYQHTLELKKSGPNSKNPGTEFIAGTVDIATDDAITNIVTVHYTYVTATTSSGKSNATYNVLKDIVDGKLQSVMKDGADVAAYITADTSFALNEFYSNRNGQEELVSVKRPEGGFLVVHSTLDEDETKRNTFDVDMIITGTRMVEADEERELPAKLILKGAIFDFRKALLPVELSVLSDGGISYFEGCEISQKNPLFTRLQGNVISEVVVTTKTEASAFGAPIVKKYTNTRKDYVVNWAAPEPYVFDDESSITMAELSKAMSDREVALAAIKSRQEEYQRSKNATPAAPAQGAFNF